MDEFIKTLEFEFQKNENPKVAKQQKSYLRDQFEFYGLKSPERREVQKPFLIKAYLPKKEELESLVKELWSKPQRDFHYFAQELVFKYNKQFKVEDITLFEFMVINNSWWDTVDFIAVKLMGTYFKMYPEQKEFYVGKWLNSSNFWLQRCALLFQLKYKTDIDVILLSKAINYLLGSKEFFINKAIGWVLREYSRTNPNWVLDFVEKTELHSLSKKEALRLIKL
ncbi:DNA-7-methylguanine glycosylase [Lutibacter oricola]|uniref:DNA-7-methylguanine glycosylase n=1 Tax=Lutibacter oricola TaxID=762486 RepID=A0A1H2U4F0_9FLAO|nr:DNA alkylation repair protein [Lutibacter oricola]SDW50798.1 DNA-7-methylguanine glycosylase [Lutibacter oricola]